MRVKACEIFFMGAYLTSGGQEREMHKPLWSYILSAGRFLSFDITGEIRFFTPSHMDHRNSSSDKDSPEARPYTRAAPCYSDRVSARVYIYI